jgi:hypothetical protein
MTTKNFALTVIVMLVAVLLTNFGIFVPPAISYESAAQERTLCIEDCKYKYAGVMGDLWRLYFKCLDDCEKDYSRRWKKEMDKLEKD